GERGHHDQPAADTEEAGKNTGDGSRDEEDQDGTQHGGMIYQPVLSTPFTPVSDAPVSYGPVAAEPARRAAVGLHDARACAAERRRSRAVPARLQRGARRRSRGCPSRRADTPRLSALSLPRSGGPRLPAAQSQRQYRRAHG